MYGYVGSWFGAIRSRYSLRHLSTMCIRDEEAAVTAALADHRNIGRKQKLFFFHPTASPGSAFWLPHGARIYNALVDLIKKEYRIREFHEVVTPNIYTKALFQQSGHYDCYKDCMFSFNCEDQEWFLKPMNCPGHCLMFRKQRRSYRELPLRLATFGVLHRNEFSGALSGLTRVRRFQQDDAHIFCRPDQICEEVLKELNFLFYVYELMGFKFSLTLSTRPEKAVGKKELWDAAEKHLADALDQAGHKWTISEGDGAFYGPKIDTQLTDAHGKVHQCGTIQLDFQLPVRFNLKYKTEQAGEANDEEEDNVEDDENNAEEDALGAINSVEDAPKGHERPVMIHRAVLGSVERMAGILMEHFAGNWPFWISPRQMRIVPVNSSCNDYARHVAYEFTKLGYHVDADLSNKTMKKKILEGNLEKYNFIGVVGNKEMANNTITVTERGSKAAAEIMKIPDIFKKFDNLLAPTSVSLSGYTDYVRKTDN